MAQVLIKIHKPDLLIYESQSKMDGLLRQDFMAYQLKFEFHKLVILENQNMVLCSLLYDNCDYEYQEKEQQITNFIIVFFRLFKIYKHNNSQPNEQENLIMEIKMPNEQHIKQFRETFRHRQAFSRYKGPLSYTPVEIERVSLLSTESPEQNYRGFINLGILILIANNIRLIVENFLKYGFLLKSVRFNLLTNFKLPFHESMQKYNIYPFFLALLVLLSNIAVAFAIQWLQFKQHTAPVKVHSQQKLLKTLILNVLNLSIGLTLPIVLIQSTHPTVNLILLGTNLTVLLKLTSYAHVMRNVYYMLERIKQLESKSNIKFEDFFPENEISKENLELLKNQAKKINKLLDIKHFIYFLFAPTLCFQLSYPRSARIRKVWLAKRFVELIGIALFQIIVWYQYVEPLLKNTYDQYEKDKAILNLQTVERLLKLAIPNTYLWISFFFGQFQVGLNILSELMRFGDRQFYKVTLQILLLVGLVELQKSRGILAIMEFACSLVADEAYVLPAIKKAIQQRFGQHFSICFFCSSSRIHHQRSCWCDRILGVFGHAFLSTYNHDPKETRKGFRIWKQFFRQIFKLQTSQIGNVMFWLSFCFLGQPLMIFIYYYHFLKKYQAISS